MIRKLTYQDIPASLRARQALEAQRRLQGVLADPATTPEHREFARRQQAVLRHWSQGTLPSGVQGPLDYQAEVASLDSPQPASRPQEHQVEVAETITATENEGVS